MESTLNLRAGDRIGRYRILRPVGEGGMARVFEASDPSGGSVALKVLFPERADDPEALREFENEARATRQVVHENVVEILGEGHENGLYFLVMEFVDGPPLHRLLEERGKLPWRTAARIVVQVARGLSHAHSLGLLHRDVKPENILLFKDGRARLIDFGIVKDVGSLKGYLLQGRQIGTAAYTSPEQCLGRRLAPATDIYSLGATFFHMLCGRPPFSGASRNEIMNRHVKSPLTPPSAVDPEIPKPVSNVVERMMQKRQSDRYETMDEVVRDLEMILKGKVAVGPSAPRANLEAVKGLRRTRRVDRRGGSGRRRAAIKMVVAGIVAAAVLVGVLLLI